MFSRLKNIFSSNKLLPSTQNLHALSKEEWGDHYNLLTLQALLQKIQNNTLTWQTKEMMDLTVAGENILEIGSGTGETSLYLALHGRNATALDFAEPCLELASTAAKQLQCTLATVLADATAPLPFPENCFDMVFQAGLLEHFNQQERIALLQQWGIVSRRMVSIIPNAASLAYRLGKAFMEQKNTWEYGLELPQYSLQNEFLAAGFTVTKEYTIGEAHALNFLPRKHYLRKALARWIDENPCEDNCGQGYLLVTCGEKL